MKRIEETQINTNKSLGIQFNRTIKNIFALHAS